MCGMYDSSPFFGNFETLVGLSPFHPHSHGNLQVSTMAGRLVSQEEFDDVVRENVEEFGMAEDEAREDAIRQFKSANLSRVATTPLQAQTHRDIEAVCASPGDFERRIAEAKAILDQVVKKQDDFALRTFANSGAVGLAIKTAQVTRNYEALDFLSSLCSNSEFAREVVPRPGVEALCKLLEDITLLENNKTFALSLLSAVSAIMKGSEVNKRVFNEFDFGLKIAQLTKVAQSVGDNELLRSSCLAIYGFLDRDDNRKGSPDQDSFGRGRKLGEDTDIVSVLVNALRNETLVLRTLSLICVNDPICLKALDAGVLKKSIEMVQNGNATEVYNLIRTVAFNDDAKKSLGLNPSFLHSLMMSIEEGVEMDDNLLLRASLSCLEVLVLRQPRCSNSAADAGAIPLLIRCLQESKDVQALTFALRALRNLVSNPENHHLRPAALEVGAEAACRALNDVPQLDVVYIEACLRDLGLDNYKINMSSQS